MLQIKYQKLHYKPRYVSKQAFTFYAFNDLNLNTWKLGYDIQPSYHAINLTIHHYIKWKWEGIRTPHLWITAVKSYTDKRVKIHPCNTIKLTFHKPSLASITNWVLESIRTRQTSGSELKWALRFSSPKARATASWPLTRDTSPVKRTRNIIKLLLNFKSYKIIEKHATWKVIYAILSERTMFTV